MSSPVSRVLSFKTVIYLRRISLYGSSRPSDYRSDKPILSALLQMGFTWHKALPQCRWALTPPFHPYPINRAVYFCCTFLRVASTGISPASCPVKLGLSSSAKKIAAATVQAAQSFSRLYFIIKFRLCQLTARFQPRLCKHLDFPQTFVQAYAQGVLLRFFHCQNAAFQ